jgi:HPt (histidine-containing phosphotransfer) domain-containing protein
VFDPDIPIIAVTAHAMSGDRERFLDAGMNYYVSKPFKAGELFNVINNALSNITDDDNVWYATEKGEDVAGAIDWAGVLERIDGDVDLLLRLLAAFRQDISGQVKELGRALEAGEAREVLRVAHSMKSASANVGAIYLRDVAGEMEAAAMVNDLKEAERRYVTLKHEADRAVEALGRFAKGNASRTEG